MGGILSGMRDAYVARYRERPLPTLFLTLMLGSLAVVAIISLCWNWFFLHTLGEMSQQLFMDHFWSVVDSMDHPYTVAHVIYPPFITCIYALIGYYTSPYVTSSTGDMYIDMYNSQVPMMVFVILMMVGLYVLFCLVDRKTDGHLTRLEKKLFIGSLLLSFPVIVGIQNGNCIFYSVIAAFLFLMFYDSENKWLRFLSYICLGISAGMKITPAILGLLIIRDRNVKEFLMCVVTMAVICLLPFVFTDGSITQLIENVVNCPPGTGGAYINIKKIFYAMAEFTGADAFNTVGSVILALTSLITVLILAFDRRMKKWKLITLAAVYLVVGYGIGTPYLCCYLVIAVCYMLSSEKEATKENIFFIASMAIILMIAPDLFALKVTMLFMLLLYLHWESFTHLMEWRKSRIT